VGVASFALWLGRSVRPTASWSSERVAAAVGMLVVCRP
jgi:hypothetical protein